LTQQQALDPLIPKSLIDSMKDAFSIQASTPVEIVGAKIAPAEDLSKGIDIVSVIGIQSSNLVGSVALCFPAATFLGIVNKMLGESYDVITSENSDAAGELLNIIYGAARVRMNTAGHDFKPAIPTVVKGNEISVNHSGNPTMVRILCKTEAGQFHLEVSLKRSAV
jgi:chemotaxis protein CheX